MLRITDVRETMPDGAAVWTLRIEGDIQGEWVHALRRAWRAVANGRNRSIDPPGASRTSGWSTPPGRSCSPEMYRDGVDILATGFSAAAIRDEIVDGSSASPGPRSRR
jgi:hypothetical protein